MGLSPEVQRGHSVRSKELRDTYAAWEAAEQLWRASELKRAGPSGLALSLLADVRTLAGRLPPAEATSVLLSALVRILELEEIGEVEARWPEIEADVTAAVELRALIRRRRAWIDGFQGRHEDLRKALLPIFRHLVLELPDGSEEETLEGGLSAPLIEQIGKPAEFIEAIIGTTFHSHLVRLDMFSTIRRTIQRNMLTASGFNRTADWRTHGDRVVPPTKHRSANPSELARIYLGGTPFEALLQLPVPFPIPEEMRFEHCHIVGGTGHGKTQLMQRMIHADLLLAARDRRSVVVIDSQGDLINKLVRLDLFAPDTPDSLADRLVVIDPADVEFPAALNLFDAHLSRLSTYRPVDRERVLNGVVELYEIFFGEMLGAELTQRQGVIFKYLARLMVSIPGATIHTLMQIMEDGRPFRAQMEQLDGSARYFFQTEFFHPSFAATKKQILKRLWGVLSTPAFERMFAQRENKLDLFEALNDGKIILISTAKDLLKAEGSALFGRFFIAMLSQAALERSTLPENERTPTLVYVDEAQEYFDDSIETILNQARKYRVGLTLAHQTLDQLSPRLRSAILANTSFKCVGGVSAKDARVLADELRTSTDFIEDMRRRGDRTEFAVWLKHLTPSAIRLSVPLGFLERQPTLPDEDFDAVLDANRARYCGTLADVPILQSLAYKEDPPTTPAARQPPPESTTSPPEAPAPLSERPPPPHRLSAPPIGPLELGKGGPKHRYLQRLVKELGEQQGFRSTIEAPVEGGQVDVLLERDGAKVAVEVSVSTPVEWERENVRKCLAAGFPLVALVLAKSKRDQARYETAITEGLSDHDRARLVFLTPEDIPDFIGSLAAPPEPSESVVKGYRVKVSLASTTPADAKARRDALARLISRSMS